MISNIILTMLPIVFTYPNLLLVPRNERSLLTFVDVDAFVQEHNLEKVASFPDFSVYSSSVENYNTFSNTFNEMFHVEEDQEITVQNEVCFTKSPVECVQECMTSPNPLQCFQECTGSGSEVQSIPWHLSSITNSNEWKYNASGSCHSTKEGNIHTYILDTGIDVDHPEFEGRAHWLENFSGDNQDTDCNSHGTHCAGLVGSKTYGSCRDAQLFAVKVLNCEGSGTLSGVIKGIEYTYNRHTSLSKENPNLRSIVSMSLGGGHSRAINNAVESCIKNSESMYFTVAAGNENSKSCNVSPASVKEVITVMAMDSRNERASFSNYDSCSDIYAPGVDVLSTIPGGKSKKYSGSSMSTPIVAGVLNHYLDKYPDMNMKEIKEMLLKGSRKDTIKGNPKNTPNNMVYLGF